MKSALYGRMRVGRCVKNDLGYVGCSANVLGVSDITQNICTKWGLTIIITFIQIFNYVDPKPKTGAPSKIFSAKPGASRKIITPVRVIEPPLILQGFISMFLQVMDSLCSGRRTCSLLVSELGVHTQNLHTTCLEDLKYYIEASYTCLPGKYTRKTNENSFRFSSVQTFRCLIHLTYFYITRLPKKALAFVFFSISYAYKN